MAKKFRDIPHKAYARVAELLKKFQSRLDGFQQFADRQVLSNRLVLGHIQTQQAAIARLQDALSAEPKYSTSYSNRLDILEAGSRDVTDSLYKLRDSVAKSFNEVSADIQKILKALQHANARAGELETQNRALISRLEVLENRVGVYDSRLKVSEDSLRLLRELLKSLQELK